MRRRIACAVLANSAQVLMPWAGTTRLRSIAGAVCSSTCERVGVVVGAAAGTITSALHGLPIATVPNLLWSEGTSSAIRCAVAWALRSGADGLLLVDGDQARLDRAHVDSLLAAFRETRTPVASYVAGDVGVPAVFGIESFARLGQLTGDRDAREVLRTTPIVKAVPWPEGSIEQAIDAAIECAVDDMVAHAFEPGSEPPTAIADEPTEPIVSAL